MEITLRFTDGLPGHVLDDIQRIVEGSETQRSAHLKRDAYLASTSLFALAMALGIDAQAVLDLAHSDGHDEPTNYHAVKTAALAKIDALKLQQTGSR